MCEHNCRVRVPGLDPHGNEDMGGGLYFVMRAVSTNVTIFGKIDHLRASNEIHFLPVQERYIHALSGNTNCLTIDGQVCFYRRLFTDAVKPRGYISWSWGALIGLHGVPNCSSRQSWPPLWIVSVHVTYWRHSTAL